MNTKRGQTWSFDLIVAVVIFIVVVGVFYAVLNRNNEGVVDTTLLEESAKAISQRLNCDVYPVSPPCFIEQGEINETKLDALTSLTYSQLQVALGTQEEVCIYLVDDDDLIIPVTGTNAGVGSNDLKIDGVIGCDGS